MMENKSLFVKGGESETSDVWLTPPEILHGLGEFDLDPCASINQPWHTAKKHYTKEDNGLEKSWFGRVWLNPPYSNIKPFMKKMADHNNGIALTFARTDTQWFHKFIFPVATGILFLEGRINFYRNSGIKSKHNGGAPSTLISYGDNSITLMESNLRGYFVNLNNDGGLNDE